MLLHGIPLSAVTWRNNIDELAKSLTVYAVDMRGFGRSDKPANADYSVPALAGVVRDLLDRLEIPRISLVGSSFGCAIAITFAHQNPRRVRKLVLINPVCYPQKSHSVTRLARMGLLATFAGPALRRPSLGQNLIAGPLRRSYADPSFATTELVQTYHQLLTHNSGERSFLATLKALDEAEVARRVPELRQQTLVIWGEQDHVLPATDADKLTRDLGHCRIELLPDAGHLPHEEQPDRVNSLIATFLAQDDTVQSGPASTH
jgi:pimeloyl-ACP methyl ester carboxylesterase